MRPSYELSPCTRHRLRLVAPDGICRQGQVGKPGLERACFGAAEVHAPVKAMAVLAFRNWSSEHPRRIVLPQLHVERRTVSYERYLLPPTVFPGSLDTKVSLQPGETLFKEDDHGDALYIVSRGTVRIIHETMVYEDVHAGGILGEMAIVDEGAPRSASAIATTYAELIKVDASQFMTLIMSAPDFALRVMRVMARRLRRMNNRALPSGQ
jgi:CRP/FNR family cyclic AMP-dependent transcriptional regulator